MDKGRQIDNIQNVNARFIDNFGASQKTSVKTSNPPGKNIFNLGGKSNFSLGWDNDEPVKQKKTVTNNPYNDVDSGKNRQKSKNDVQVDQNLKNYYNVLFLFTSAL